MLKRIKVNEKVGFDNLADKMRRIQAELGDKCVFIIAVDDKILEILRIEVLDMDGKEELGNEIEGKIDFKNKDGDKIKPKMELDSGISYIG